MIVKAIIKNDGLNLTVVFTPNCHLYCAKQRKGEPMYFCKYSTGSHIDLTTTEADVICNKKNNDKFNFCKRI